MKLIDADVVIKGVQDRCLGTTNVIVVENRIIDMLNRMPAVDAEPVIRCKDCVYKNEYGYCTLYINFHHLTEEMGYCSDAERREHEID